MASALFYILYSLFLIYLRDFLLIHIVWALFKGAENENLIQDEWRTWNGNVQLSKPSFDFDLYRSWELKTTLCAVHFFFLFIFFYTTLFCVSKCPTVWGAMTKKKRGPSVEKNTWLIYSELEGQPRGHFITSQLPMRTLSLRLFEHGRSRCAEGRLLLSFNQHHQTQKR